MICEINFGVIVIGMGIIVYLEYVEKVLVVLWCIIGFDLSIVLNLIEVM